MEPRPTLTQQQSTYKLSCGLASKQNMHICIECPIVLTLLADSRYGKSILCLSVSYLATTQASKMHVSIARDPCRRDGGVKRVDGLDENKLLSALPLPLLSCS